MELFTILFTLVIVVPITFPFILIRLALYCLGFYLKKKHSITLRVGKCGLISVRSVSICLPYFPQKPSDSEKEDGHRNDDVNTNCCGNELSITIDNVRLSSIYLDNSCASILSICFNNITVDGPLDEKTRLPIKIGACELPINRIRGDFLKHYQENFNISMNEIVIAAQNFSYKIEKLSVIKSVENQNNLQIKLDRIIFSDLSIPEVRTFSDIPQELTRQRILFIELLEILYFINHNKNLNAKFVGDCFLQFNLEFYQNICMVIGYTKALFFHLKGSNKAKENIKKADRTQSQILVAKLELDGRLSIGAITSDEHITCIETHSLEVNACFPGPKTMQTKMACLHFDDNAILSCTVVSISHHPSPGISYILDRKQNSCGYNLIDDTNSLLCVDIESANFFFPYKYNFAEAFNENFIGILKWLKKFHCNPHKFEKDRPIDFDISVKINKFTFEIEDDPFESKLRNNYMLLEDEYHEQLKRDQTLQEKINELKRTNLMLASSIVEELNRALAKKNSDIYIQRSKQLYSSESRRVPVFRVNIEEAELKILADSSFHKHSDIRKLIRNYNPEAQMCNDIKFSTLWCRIISSNFKNVDVSLRDFPMSMVDSKDLTMKGILIGTEQTAVARARRHSRVYIGRNSEPQFVERSMTALKLFHNLQIRCTTANYTHGPCWEPVLQQVSLAFEDIVSASSDPSPSLAWWDKVRFIFHGPAKLNCNQLSVVLHASNDPYNQTELIELTLFRAQIDWTTGKIRFKGDFDALLHTASKYDECRFMHIPNLDLTTYLSWNCVGNPHDHFSIMPCAPDKVPDYSSHHSHDSYRSFRSQSVSLLFNIETQFTSPTSSLNLENMPSMLFFGSTIRWLENQKFIFTGPPKLTRRGELFNNIKPRKPSLTRIIREIRVTSSLNCFQIVYWSSVSKKHGIQILGGELVHSSEHSFKLAPNTAEGLIRRKQAYWQTNYMNSSLTNVEVWLYNLSSDDLDEFNEFNVQTNVKNRQYFISLSKVCYNREALLKRDDNDFDAESSEEVKSFKKSQLNHESDQVPNHKLVVHDLKAAWTKDNRDVIVGIFDAFVKSQKLKRNLSTEALKLIRIETPTTTTLQNVSNNSPPYRHQRQPSTTSLILTNATNPVSTVSKNRAVSMLQKLIADSENNPTVYTEESHSGVASETHLYGVEACSIDDVVEIKCLIELINSQVVLCGTETSGYVIVSSANTEIRQTTHLPVWKNRTLLSKTTWTGLLRDMQYYATVDGSSQDVGGRRVFTNENDIQWLNPDNIETRSTVFDYPDLVGSGHSVGGVVSPIVGKSDCSSDIDTGFVNVELQRIISRCDCQFYYASHTDGVPEDLQHLIPPLPEDDMFIEPWDKEVGVDSFTLNHQDLDISTNSQQYAMIMDIINHLLLYVEPHKKTAFEKLERMRFRFQLSADEDQREPISQLQDQVRCYIAYLKRLERERYLVYRASIDDSMTQNEHEHDYRLSLNTLSCEIDAIKEQLNSASEELAMMISCYKEMQLGAHKAQKQQAASQQGSGAFFANVIKRDEICFKNARWRLTDSDGQLGLADIVLNNFLYSKVAKSDDSVEHTIELGHLHVSNLIPNQAYKDVLHPTELQANIPLDRQRALRVYCRELAPVAGIPVKEHLEVNVVPFTIEVTLQFFQKMVKFFFPERDSAKDDKSRRVLDLSGEHQLARFGSKRRNKEKAALAMEPPSPLSGAGSIASGSSGSRGSGLSNPAMSGNNLRVEDTISTISTATMNSTASVSSLNSNQRRGEEIEKMRERASKNHTFVYVKVPGIPVRISYKGKKQKNVTDLKNMSLTLPTYEYHNCTWTWLDLLMAVKNDSKHTVIKQALKQKMKIRPSSIWSKAANNDQQVSSSESGAPKDKSSLPVTDEDKARLLLGQYARKVWRSEPDSTSQSSFDKYSE